MLGWSFGGTPVTVACDVTTRFLDAATVFAPQKGATEAQVSLLTRRLALLADQYEQRTGVDVRELAGAGAAGGLAGGLAAIGAELEPGFDVVAGAVDLETRSRVRSSSSPVRVGSTRAASRARSSVA